jgi:hypothetical protein
MRLKCGTCGGEYDSVLPDGMRYFHACPPVRFVLVTRKRQPLYVQPANLLVDDVVTVTAGGKTREISSSAMLVDDDFMFTRMGPRPGHRDENVIATGPHQGEPIAAALEKDDVEVLPDVIDAPFDDTPVIV